MSGSIYLCAASLCCCLVVCAVIRMIVPNGSTSRIISVVIGVFVLCCIFSPVISIVKNVKMNFNEKNLEVKEEEFVYSQDDKVINETAKYINEYVNNLLSSREIYNSSIKTVLAVDEDRVIYIKEINIYLDKEHLQRTDEIKKIIVEYIGVSPIITENVYG